MAPKPTAPGKGSGGRDAGPTSHGMPLASDVFRELCESAYDFIQSVSPDGDVLYVNRAWREALGYSLEDVIGHDIFEFIHPDSQAHCREAFRAVFSGKALGDVLFALRAKDGRRVDVSGSVRCRFEDGRPVATSAILREVTDAQRKEQERERLFDMSLDLLCVAGTDGYFKQVNPAFERVLGHTADELLSQSFISFIHPDDREATITEVQKLAKGLPVVDFQNRYRTKRGQYRWLAWRAAPMAGTTLIYAIARDITESKRIQQRMLQQAEDLARSNADLEQFAYAASHDLRAPLRAIENLAEWIEEDTPGGAPEKVREHIATLRRRVQRMDTLIEDLLNFYRAGHEEIEASRVNTAELVRDVAALFPAADAFTIEPVGELPVFETARPALELVLRNLIGNAIKHHDRETGRIKISARRRGTHYRFSVADDGPGIPEEHREQVFGIFQQLKPRDKVEGTGVGLALVRRIVERYGGRVRVLPSEGRGATFEFDWPVELPNAEDDHGDHPDRR